MRALIDLTGQKFDRLTAIERVITDKKRTLWFCECVCGNTTVAEGWGLRNGRSRSCGCYVKDKAKENFTKHGCRQTRLYVRWVNMRDRCANQKSKSYERYGGRGISVCDGWRDDFSSFNAWATSSGYKDDLTIERIDNNGNYEPSNCCWIPMKDQAKNRRSTTRINIGGITKSLTEWERSTGIQEGTLRKRMHLGWRNGDLLNPVRKGNYGKKNRVCPGFEQGELRQAKVSTNRN